MLLSRVEKRRKVNSVLLELCSVSYACAPQELQVEKLRHSLENQDSQARDRATKDAKVRLWPAAAASGQINVFLLQSPCMPHEKFMNADLHLCFVDRRRTGTASARTEGGGKANG